MLLFLAALLPCLVSDQDPAAVTKLRIHRICTEAAADERGPAPGVEYRVNEASASRSPWLTANGWRAQRASHKRLYYDVQGDAASIAAVEAYAYEMDAAIHTDAKGLAALGEI